MVQKFASDGTPIWLQVLSTDVYETAWGLAIAADDAVWVGHGLNVGFGQSDGELRLTKLAP